MSNLLKQKLHGKTIKFFGPPGTGKTHRLLKRVARFLEQGGAKPKAKFKGLQSRHWVVVLPKQSEHKNKDVKFTKAKAAWEDN